MPLASLSPRALLRPLDIALFAITVFAWSTSWIALKWQVGVVAPEVSLAYRFGIAAAIMVIKVAASSESLRFPPADHLRFALQGFLLFSVNFYLFYLGGRLLTSGLLSVVFSLASVTNLLLAALVLRQPIDGRAGLGAALGVIGIGLVFWPEIGGTDFSGPALAGLAFCCAGTLCFSIGNMLAVINRRRGLPLWPMTAWCMVYGAGFMVLLALLHRSRFTYEASLPYLGGLLWLALVSSLIAFAAYLTLLGRIGAGRAGYATVMTPLLALGISTVLEGYHWTPAAIAGLVAVGLGNVVVLARNG